MKRDIVVLPGDGIGPEVMTECARVIDWVSHHTDLKITTTHDLVGGASIDVHGVPVTDAVIAKCKNTDAVMLGAVGGSQWDKVDYTKRPEMGLLRLRKDLDLFANLRPAVVYDALIDASTLKPDVVRGLDILIVRELTGGIYFGTPRGIEDLGNGERRGVNTHVYTTSEIRRVADVAFGLAKTRKGKVTSVEKANAMDAGKLWREDVTKLHAEKYTGIKLDHMLADNCAMQLLKNPRQFDVIVTDNLFGDILSDEASMLTGSLGLLPSASIGAMDQNGKRPALYEPIHGSAPDIAGRGVANPLATILSFAMCLRFSFDRPDLADKIEHAVERVLESGCRTADIAAPGATPLTTTQMGDAVLTALK
jgi:3-isopropylmalate dehydrogenase